MKILFSALLIVFSSYTSAQTLSVEKIESLAYQLLLRVGLTEDIDFEQPPRISLLESYFTNEEGDKFDLTGVAVLFSVAGDSSLVADYQYVMFHLPADGSRPEFWLANVDQSRNLTGYGVDQMSIFLDPSETVVEEAEALVRGLIEDNLSFGEYLFYDQIGLLWFNGLFANEGFSLYKYLSEKKSLEVELAEFWSPQVFEMGPLIEILRPLICIDDLRDRTKGVEFVPVDLPPRPPGTPTLFELLSVDEPCPVL